MSELVGLGEAAHGALLARAVEPDTGAPRIDPDGHTAESACLNCRTALAGEFCHACGQRAHVHRTLGSLVHDLAHGVFHFEGKIWRTLPMLAWRPGDVTRRYIDGERARFVSPLALFLFSVFLLATVLGSLPLDNSLDGLSQGLSHSGRSLERAQRENAAKLKQLAVERDGIRASGGSLDEIDRRIARVREDQQSVEALQSDRPGDLIADAKVSSKLGWVNERWKHAKQNPDLLIYKLKNSAYKYSWVLVPLSLPFMWLLFPFSRRFGMYDHAIFVIYSLASISLLTVVLSLVPFVPGVGKLAALGFVVLPPVHMYRQLRGGYSLGRVSALLRTILLLLFASLAFAAWVVFLMLVGAA